MSRARQNFDKESEAALNQQVLTEYVASYTYQSMSAYLSRDDISLPGLAKYCAKCADEERGHALKFSDYIISRGGRTILQTIPAPSAEWESALNILVSILQLERDVNESLLNLHAVAEKYRDHHLTDFLEGTFLDEQVKAIKEVSDMITQLKRCLLYTSPSPRD